MTSPDAQPLARPGPGAPTPVALRVGPDAIPLLAKSLSSPDPEVARDAKRVVWAMVRHAGQPGARRYRNGVIPHLIRMLADSHPAPRREALWMLSEIGGNEAVNPMAALLTDPVLREDARITLQRIGGPRVVAALKHALEAAPEDFKPSIAQGMRALGAKVEAWPSQNLVPCKATSVKPPTGS